MAGKGRQKEGGSRNRKPSSHITSVVRKQRIGCGVSYRSLSFSLVRLYAIMVPGPS